jgi:hypothetical protein
MTVAKKTDQEIWYRGYGDDQYVYYARKGPKEFLGGVFTVESYEDLEKYVDINVRIRFNLTKAQGLKATIS